MAPWGPPEAASGETPRARTSGGRRCERITTSGSGGREPLGRKVDQRQRRGGSRSSRASRSLFGLETAGPPPAPCGPGSEPGRSCLGGGPWGGLSPGILASRKSRLTSRFEPRASRIEAFCPAGAPLVAAAGRGSENLCVWTPGGVRGFVLSGVWVRSGRRQKKTCYGRFFDVLGLRRPFLGPGTVKK